MRDPLTDSPGANWHLRLASGGQYGPQSSEIMRQWLNEGRITADALVWRDGWADWKPAGTVFPSLAHARPLPAPAPGMMAGGMMAGGMARPGMAPGYAPGGYAPGGMQPGGYAQQAVEEPANEFEVSPTGYSSSGGAGGGGGGGYVPPRRDNTLIQASMIVLVLALVVLVPLMIWALTNQPVVDREGPPPPKVNTKTITKQPNPNQPPPKSKRDKSGEEKMRL